MMHRLRLLLALCFFCAYSFAQTSPDASCGQQAVMQHFYAMHPEYKTINQQVEKILAQRNRALQSGALATQRTAAIVTLPVVVHIVHNNGVENISDAQVFQGIQHLNEAYANSGYYDPVDGVNTQIQFCMAQRDPANTATNGITRDVSPYTVMGGPAYYADDQQVKDVNRWNPLCYINIWIVKSIPTSVVGYAYLPSAHGSLVDGIIIEAGYFGSSYANDVVAAHEMGHYLGLYHTFEGGCSNNDCTADGDKVCDTPPDQSTAGISCNASANSCTTDILSGFATDQNDLTQDYMDYGNFNCMKVFTQGQSDRMNWFIQNVRKSLLACKSCMNPCPAPVTASFSLPAAPYLAGTNYTFANTSVNAASYEWYVNGILQGSVANFSYTFPSPGTYNVKMIARSSNALCDDAVKTVSLPVVCGVTAGFTKSAGTVPAATYINFTNTSTGADNYEWWVNSILQSTAASFAYTSSTAGDYVVKLVAGNSVAKCQQVYIDTVHYTCAVTADFIPFGNATLINIPVTFTSTGTGAINYQWLVNGILAGTGAVLTYTFTTAGAYSIQLVSDNGTCSAAKTGIEYVSDKCGNAQYQFQKNYAIAQTSSAQDVQSAADGGAVLAERTIMNGGSQSGAILKLDPAGNSQWLNNYNYDGGTNSTLRKIKLTADGGYIAIGNVTPPGSTSINTFIVKTTATGAIAWSRDLSIQGTSGNEGFNIISSADGSYYFTGSVTSTSAISSLSDVLAGKLDGSGNLQWLVSLDGNGTETGTGIAEDKNHLIICGNKSAQLGNSGFLLQLNKSDGSVVWANSYQSTGENFLDVQVIPNGYFVNATRRSAVGGLFTDHVYLQTDFNGKLFYSVYLQPFGTSVAIGWASAVVNTDGHISSQSTPALGGAYNDFIIQEIDPATGIRWARHYNKNNVWLTCLATAPDKSPWAGGFSLESTLPSLRSFVMKPDSLGNSGSCPAVETTPVLLTAFYNRTIADFRGKTIQPKVNTRHLATPVTVTDNTLCQFVTCDSVALPIDTCALCTTIALAGNDTVCSLVTPITYSIKRSIGCPGIPAWHLAEPTQGTITVINDSTITIAFNKPGPVTLYASMGTGCEKIEDSLTIAVRLSPAGISLGPDILLCSFSTIRLSAGAGFATYVWNDGSTDSLLTAFNPGKYYVTATDYCGMAYSDSVQLTLGPVIPFDLGPDLKKCGTDTLTLTAPGNFSSYSWGAGYHISQLTGATVQVWPVVDTTYTVIGKVANGCTVIDSIHIRVQQSPPLHIGNDTSFCAGDSVVLQASPGFTTYKWQDGSTDNQFTGLQKGLYWLQATAANGCIAKDSITIKSVYPLPVKFADTEAEVCNGSKLELKALGSWPAYLWFNQSVAPAVTVNGPGTYWLQVTSAEGCVARTTIVVSSAQGCRSGIWFPNAFTPDRNGSNDSYKPVVAGMPIAYQLYIYNRFGEKVFATTDCKKGWNGIYKGQLQPAGGFVWYCLYQFAGAPSKMEKGALVMIR